MVTAISQIQLQAREVLIKAASNAVSPHVNSKTQSASAYLKKQKYAFRDIYNFYIGPKDFLEQRSLFSDLRRLFDNAGECINFKAGPADQTAVDFRLLHQFGDIVRGNTAAVKDAQALCETVAV